MCRSLVLSWCGRTPALADWSMSWTIDPLQADDSRTLSKGVSDAAGGTHGLLDLARLAREGASRGRSQRHGG